jgi:hypothetical protein
VRVINSFCIIFLFLGFAKALAYEAYDREPVAVEKSLSFKNIEEKFAKAAPKTIEEFLAWIGQDYPAQLKNYTLMFHSESLQGASPEFPRALVFGPDARLIFTFNGHPRQKGFYKIELLHFQDKREVIPAKNQRARTGFEFREITFDPQGKTRAKISAKNPARCMQCHTTNYVPIWRQYQTWDGAYGRRDDNIADYSGQTNASPTGFPAAEYSKEYRDFKIFSSLAPAHVRYRFLNSPEGSSVSPYSEKLFGEYRYRPNLRLTLGLAALEARRLADKIRESPFYPHYQLPLLAFLKNCSVDYASRSPWNHFKQTLRSDLQQYLNVQEMTPYARLPQESDLNLQAWLLTLFKIDREEWSLDRKVNFWEYHDGIQHMSDLVFRELKKDLAPELVQKTETPVQAESVDGEYQPFVTPDLCEVLTTEILKTPPTLPPREKYLSKSPRTLQLCMSCHGSENHLREKAPFIPFDKPRKLRQDFADLIRERALSKEASMPPMRRLTVHERKELEAILQGED